MTLVWLILLPLFGGVAAWLSSRLDPRAPRFVALLTCIGSVAIGLSLWATPAGDGRWLAELALDWIPSLGARFHLAADGLSLVLVLLTGLMGVAAVLASWHDPEEPERAGAFFACLLWSLAGIAGVFLAIDLLLFFVLWEAMLLPLVFLIGLFGHERRLFAAVKFFLYTQAGSLLLLVAIVALHLFHARATGVWTFDYEALLDTPLPAGTAAWLMLGFTIAFAIKLPVVPLHNWLPDAHAEAPTAGSIVLAGLTLKTGAYGLMRFSLPLFPEAAAQLAPLAMALGAFSALYGAKLAFAQTDLKRLIAYTSVSHMGFVLLGIFAWTPLALQGVTLYLVCHALSTGGLFALAGMLIHRRHSRDIASFGGLAASAPRMSGLALVFALASLGLPGLGTFTAELLTLLGAFDRAPIATGLCAASAILATAYSLRLYQRIFQGPPETPPVPDLRPRELLTLGCLALLLLSLGLWPRPVIEQAKPALDHLQHGRAVEIQDSELAQRAAGETP